MKRELFMNLVICLLIEDRFVNLLLLLCFCFVVVCIVVVCFVLFCFVFCFFLFVFFSFFFSPN